MLMCVLIREAEKKNNGIHISRGARQLALLYAMQSSVIREQTSGNCDARRIPRQRYIGWMLGGYQGQGYSPQNECQ